MADDDKPAESAGEGTEPRRGGQRGARAARGERDRPGGGAPSHRDVEAALATMDPNRLAGLLAAAQARSAGVGGVRTPKLSATLDRLDAETADSVIEACDEALEVFEVAQEQRKPADTGQALAPIRDASPDVEAAILTNSAYRKQPVQHSVSVVKRYLESHHGKDAEPDRPSAR